MITTVLFDLDGTLLDTAPDLAGALNDLRQRYQQPPIPFAEIRPQASNGSAGLLSLGFNVDTSTPRYAVLQTEFLALYQQQLGARSRLFSGMQEVLSNLAKQGLKWGIVTNKPAFLTMPLISQLGLLDQAACVVSGDTLPLAKPHPEPLWHACELIGAVPKQCIYVGDAERDMLAGKRAGMLTMLAKYGYLAETADIAAWPIDVIIEQPLDITAYLEKQFFLK